MPQTFRDPQPGRRKPIQILASYEEVKRLQAQARLQGMAVSTLCMELVRFGLAGGDQERPD